MRGSFEKENQVLRRTKGTEERGKRNALSRGYDAPLDVGWLGHNNTSGSVSYGGMDTSNVGRNEAPCCPPNREGDPGHNRLSIHYKWFRNNFPKTPETSPPLAMSEENWMSLSINHLE